MKDCYLSGSKMASVCWPTGCLFFHSRLRFVCSEGTLPGCWAPPGPPLSRSPLNLLLPCWTSASCSLWMVSCYGRRPLSCSPVQTCPSKACCVLLPLVIKSFSFISPKPLKSPTKDANVLEQMSRRGLVPSLRLRVMAKWTPNASFLTPCGSS